MQGRLTGWPASAVWVATISRAIGPMPATSASCEPGSGSRARRDFTAGGGAGATAGSRLPSDSTAAIRLCRGTADWRLPARGA